MLYNFTIIIPHKNIPKLLQRCLDSIPIREDIQIIIIDDNSENLDKKNFPGLGRKNTNIIFSSKSLTAGGARNLGLKKAEGKWLLFADSDDFFHQNFSIILDKYVNSEYDLIYFGMDSVFSENLKPANRASHIPALLKKATLNDEKAKNIIRFKFLYPSCKLIKKELIIDNRIIFDEVPASNDTMFGIKVSFAAKKILYLDDILYCLTHRENSLVTSYNYQNLKSRLLVSFRLYFFLKNIGKEEYAQSSIEHLMQIRNVSYLLVIKDLFLVIKILPFFEFLSQTFNYLNSFKNAR